MTLYNFLREWAYQKLDPRIISQKKGKAVVRAQLWKKMTGIELFVQIVHGTILPGALTEMSPKTFQNLLSPWLVEQVPHSDSVSSLCVMMQNTTLYIPFTVQSYMWQLLNA